MSLTGRTVETLTSAAPGMLRSSSTIACRLRFLGPLADEAYINRKHQHVTAIVSGILCPEFLEASEKESCDHYEDDCECGLGYNKRAVEKTTARASKPGSYAHTRCRRGSQCRKQTKQKAAERRNDDSEQSDSKMGVRSIGNAPELDVARRRRSSLPRQAKASPRKPPQTAMTKDSVRSCRTIRMRPAPSASRVVISLRRDSDRETSRAPTFRLASESTPPSNMRRSRNPRS